MSIHIALIYGSTREGRLCDKVAEWASSEIAKRSEFSLDLIDPAALALPGRHNREGSPDLLALRQRIGKAEGFVIVTPEYNHSFPAAVKFLVDSVHEQWHAKPVAFVSYGGVSGGLRAVEHLRLVFAELHAMTIRDSVSFPHVWSMLDSGKLRPSSEAEKSMSVMLDRLKWWAVALRLAREARPYERAIA